MITKHDSKLALVAIAVASLVFSGCSSKKDDMAMSDHAGKANTEVAAPAEPMETMEPVVMLEKPSTNSVYFAFDSAVVNDAGQMILSEYANWLNENTDVSITVEGNCDERGSREYNLALGEERAKAVRNILVANGVDGTRVDTVSFGEERPVCSRSGEACWAQNRHGDIVNR